MMALLIDAKEYVEPLTNWFGYFMIFISVFLFTITTGAFLLLTDHGNDPTYSCYFCFGILLSYFLIFLFMMNIGYVHRVPLKIFDHGFEIQPQMRFKKKLVAFSDIESIEFSATKELLPRGSCILKLRNGSILRSQEHFRWDNGLEIFVEILLPQLANKGFVLVKKYKKWRYMNFQFQR